MASTGSLGDKAVAVFAFAAYHQLESGQAVTEVIKDDGKGHHADEEGVAELKQAGLATDKGNGIQFTESGLAILTRVVDAVKAAASGA